MILVMNAVTNAVWEYGNYPFNSFCEFAGMYLAAGAEGVVQIETGDDDAGTPIDAVFSYGKLSLSGDNLSRLGSVYFGSMSSGDLQLTVTTDGGQSADYQVSPIGDGLQPTRTTPGKGLRGKYWQFTVANVDGCDFSIDSLTIDTATTARRR